MRRAVVWSGAAPPPTAANAAAASTVRRASAGLLVGSSRTLFVVQDPRQASGIDDQGAAFGEEDCRGPGRSGNAVTRTGASDRAPAIPPVLGPW
jgi:hypothetical protein